MSDHVNSGIPAVGPLRWGTHFCQFYETADDLIDVLVPYFKAGVDGNEQCLWVTSQPLGVADARDALRSAVPDLDRRIARGQITLADYRDWYGAKGKIGADDLLNGWLRLKQSAIDSGYEGLRATGNTYFLEAADWDSFAEYESKVSGCFCDHRLIAICSYCTERCNAGGVLDVVESHEFALARRRGAWTLLESSQLKQAKADLKKANEELETRVAQRTAALSEAYDAARQSAAEKDVLLQEVHHRVKNNLQVVTSLLALKAGRSSDPALREAFDDTLRRVTAMSMVHEALYQNGTTSSIEFADYLQALGEALLASFGMGERISLSVRGRVGHLDLNTAVPVGLIAAEAISNALKHAFPDGRAGSITIGFNAPDGSGPGELTVTDDGIGVVATDRQGGAGLFLATAIARQVDGTVSIRPGAERGSRFLLQFRAATDGAEGDAGA